MARCKNCGKANRDGALFCQDCGRSIDGSAYGPGGGVAAVAATAASASIPIAHDDEPLPIGRSAAAQVVSTPESPAPGSERSPAKEAGLGGTSASADSPCESCGTMNPISASFCRSCGQNLNLKQRPQTKIACSHCGHPTPAGFMYCQHCGNRIIPEAASRPASPRRGSNPPKAAAPVPVAPAPKSSAEPASKGSVRGRFVIVRRDGSDGDTLSLGGDSCDLGRATHRSLADDPYLAARHLRVFPSSSGVRVRPLDTVNGVFWQLREPHELVPGDVFFVGRELIRFELLSSDERDLPAVSEQGVRVLGSIPRESWGRLRQLTTAAVSRDIWHVSRPEILLGREEGDIVFPDDEFMSRRHALVSRVGGKVRLEDQNSSNGTYVRLRGDRDIVPGDILRLGEQVLRYEP